MSENQPTGAPTRRRQRRPKSSNPTVRRSSMSRSPSPPRPIDTRVLSTSLESDGECSQSVSPVSDRTHTRSAPSPVSERARVGARVSSISDRTSTGSTLSAVSTGSYSTHYTNCSPTRAEPPELEAPIRPPVVDMEAPERPTVVNEEYPRPASTSDSSSRRSVTKANSAEVPHPSKAHYRWIRRLRLVQSHFSMAAFWNEILILIVWICQTPSAITDDIPNQAQLSNDHAPTSLKYLHYATTAIGGASLIFSILARCAYTHTEALWTVAFDAILSLANLIITIAVGAELAPEHNGTWPLSDMYYRGAHTMLLAIFALSSSLFVAMGIIQTVGIVRFVREQNSRLNKDKVRGPKRTAAEGLWTAWNHGWWRNSSRKRHGTLPV
ncbi:hypothetical protein F5Y16DRAFT_37949 [Xylariaceae sp. FL0255]|nr:hypothetical protein F5Y16DRAFT_37949 [Xylariaceae sp. FL0255]